MRASGRLEGRLGPASRRVPASSAVGVGMVALGHQAWLRDLHPASHDEVPPRAPRRHTRGPLGWSRGLSLQAEATHGGPLPSDSPRGGRGPRPRGSCRPPLRSSLPALGFFHPASCPARSPWAPCLTPACPGPEGTAGCSPASVRPRCPEGADPPIGDIKGKQEAAAPPTPRGREECVSQRGRGPAAGDFPSAAFPQDTPAPASAPTSRWSGAGGHGRFQGQQALSSVSPRLAGASGHCALGTGHTLTGGGTGPPSRPAGEKTPQRSVRSPRSPGWPS